MYKIHIVNAQSGDTEMLLPASDELIPDIEQAIFLGLAGGEIRTKTPDIDWAVTINNLIDEKLAGFYDDVENLSRNLQKTIELLDVQGKHLSALSLLFQEKTTPAVEEKPEPTVEQIPPQAKKKRKYNMEGGKRILSAATAAKYAKYGRTPPKAQWGKYCRNCGTELDGTSAVFCNRKCSARWRDDHKGQKATPRYSLNEKQFEHKITAGVGVESPAYNAAV